MLCEAHMDEIHKLWTRHKFIDEQHLYRKRLYSAFFEKENLEIKGLTTVVILLDEDEVANLGSTFTKKRNKMVNSLHCRYKRFWPIIRFQIPCHYTLCFINWDGEKSLNYNMIIIIKYISYCSIQLSVVHFCFFQKTTYLIANYINNYK